MHLSEPVSFRSIRLVDSRISVHVGAGRVISELSDLEGAEPGEFAQQMLFFMLYAWWISVYTCTLLGLWHNVEIYAIYARRGHPRGPDN
jgi:hypothetical protein